MSFNEDQREGFLELLDATGQTFLYETEQFRGVAKTLEPKPEEFDLTPSDDDQIQVSVLGDEIPDGLKRIGETFTDGDGVFYRITRMRKSPNSILVRLECKLQMP